MFSKPRQAETESALYDAAVRLLARRAHSVQELRQALHRRADLIQSVLDRLTQNGLLDDARFAKQFARQRTEIRRQGPFRIARDLRSRGAPDPAIETAPAQNAEEHGEAALVRQRLQRKLRALRGPHADKKLDDKKLAFLYRSLLRAGFSAAVVRREVKFLTSAIRATLPSSGMPRATTPDPIFV